MKNKNFYRVAEAADFLGITIRQVYNLHNTKTLIGVLQRKSPIDRTKVLRFAYAELDQLKKALDESAK